MEARVEEFGNGRPPSEAEAAAIAAALERFLAETAPAAVGTVEMDPWLRQALIDGVSAKAEFGPGEPPGFG